jgi:SAM-dependent methyltransferase
MNAVEIEEAFSDLVSAPFDATEFPFQFLAAFGAKDVTIARLRDGHSNPSDLPGGVLQRNNVHIAIAIEGEVSRTLSALRASPKTKTGKVKFILSTDGVMLEAENLRSGELLVCDYAKAGEYFGFFLALAGISATKELTDNPVDVKATFRLNKLYVELLRENPDWSSPNKRPVLNRFLARLIFCFFAEDTGIFFAHQQFTDTVEQMSDGQSKNTHEIVEYLFRVMDTKLEDRAALNIRPWAATFPYVNGALFSGGCECPRFTKLARSYFLSAGTLDWKDINPDIFGSMIQAVADEGSVEEGETERSSLGMHYTSVPNILKVLNPLFLDELRETLDRAGTNTRKLRALRRRLAAIRVFDPACGSGNFLVIAYLQMREIEHAIAERLGDDPRSWIRIENFYGIEIKGFAAEIARLALLIAEFQADCRYVNEQQARLAVLPLHKTGQIQVTNALRVDWLAICPPARSLVEEYDLLGPTGRFVVADDMSEDGIEPETFVCSNPPYRGSKWQDRGQKDDLLAAWREHPHLARTTDYVSGWLAKAEHYLKSVPNTSAAFVMTNSIVQGQQAGDIWSALFDGGLAITFAHRSFKWQNLATHNAGVTVVVVGIALSPLKKPCRLYEDGHVRSVDSIGCYLLPNQTTIIRSRDAPISALPPMTFGNMARDGGHLILDERDLEALRLEASPFVFRFFGSQELITGIPRYCLWIDDDAVEVALRSATIASRLQRVRDERLSSKAASTRAFAAFPHRFVQRVGVGASHTIAIPRVSSESRDFLPCDLLPGQSVISDRNFAIFDGELWPFALIVSRLHWVWIATVCVRLEMRFSYSNTIGWNNFPVPLLTENAKSELTRSAEHILLAREAHYPAGIDELYIPDAMPDNLIRAHAANDELIERIFIGRRFRNDTERLEHLFALYEKMTAHEGSALKATKKEKGA